MPLARIDLPAGKPSSYGRAVADVVYNALIAALKAPKDDRFQVISEHSRDTLLIDPSYLGIERSTDALIIQLTLNEGRTLEAKKEFFKAVADELHESLGLRREDVFISLVEVKKENWSFGNGIAQYAWIASHEGNAATGAGTSFHSAPLCGQDATLLMILNSFHDVVNFALPESPGGGRLGAAARHHALDQKGRLSFKFGNHYQVTGRSLLLFLMRPKRAAFGRGWRR